MKSLFLSFLCLLLFSNSSFAQSTIYPSGVSGCIARWDFSSNGSINALPDVSGNGNNGTVNNLSPAEGFRHLTNRAMLFDGSSSFAQIPGSTQLCPQAMTMIALVKFNGFYSGHCQGNQIISKGWPEFITGQYGLAVGDNNYDGSCDIFSPNSEGFEASYGTTTTNPNNGFFIDTAYWYFFASSYDGNIIRYYEVLMDPSTHQTNIIPFSTSPNQNNPIGTNTFDISIGKHLDPNFPYWFNGVMDEAAIFNKVLSDSEIQSVYDYLWGYLAIDHPNTDTSLCLDGAFNVHYVTNDSGIFQTGNIFTIQLSDLSGSFANPVNIGSVTATTSGNISCAIPLGTPYGNNYRLRIIATNPSFISEDTAHITIGPSTLPSVNVTSSPTTYHPGNTVTFTAHVSNNTSVTYQWKKNGVNIIGATSSTYTTNNLVVGDNIDVTIYASSICTSPDSATSNTIALDVNTIAVNRNAIHLYPNPTGGNLNISGTLMSNSNKAEVAVINELGQVLFSNVLPLSDSKLNEQLSLPAEIPSGLYLLRLTAGEQTSILSFSLSR